MGLRPDSAPGIKMLQECFHFQQSSLASAGGYAGLRKFLLAGTVRNTSTKFLVCGNLLDLHFSCLLRFRTELNFLSSVQVITAAPLVQGAFRARFRDRHRCRDVALRVCPPAVAHLYFAFATKDTQFVRSSDFSCPSAHSSPTVVTGRRRTDFLRG